MSKENNIKIRLIFSDDIQRANYRRFDIDISRERESWSITGEAMSPNSFQIDMCGAIHEAILQMAPDLKPFVDLHLSDLDGVPMHAVENAYYWAGGTKWNNSDDNSPPNVNNLASHLRISKDEAEQLRVKVMDEKITKEEFADIVNAMRPRWKQESSELNEKFDNIIKNQKSAIVRRNDNAYDLSVYADDIAGLMETAPSLTP